MRIHVLAASVALALGASTIEAQTTLGDSVVAGNDAGATMTTDTDANNGTISFTGHVDKNPAGHAGLNHSKSHAVSSGADPADSYVTTVTQNNSTPAPSNSQKLNGSHDGGAAKQKSGASGTFLAFGVSLVALALAATL
ncbi:hypothetical protein PsorP6_015629 [Peronosclerospora sorghi]|uniref:Uncharacterized protein n=1 Tax=Peronosclerospora sorghi TaxID=230839 RepID=A0ACC0WP98_9STRA|nr:hypothetical protein PsorP6_015629 [Peronosclerospora sorghi]